MKQKTSKEIASEYPKYQVSFVILLHSYSLQTDHEGNGCC